MKLHHLLIFIDIFLAIGIIKFCLLMYKKLQHTRQTHFVANALDTINLEDDKDASWKPVENLKYLVWNDHIVQGFKTEQSQNDYASYIQISKKISKLTRLALDSQSYTAEIQAANQINKSIDPLMEYLQLKSSAAIKFQNTRKNQKRRNSISINFERIGNHESRVIN